jgi:hypothetical protein
LQVGAGVGNVLQRRARQTGHAAHRMAEIDQLLDQQQTLDIRAAVQTVATVGQRRPDHLVAPFPDAQRRDRDAHHAGHRATAVARRLT